MKKALIVILVLVGLLTMAIAGIFALYGLTRAVTRDRVAGTTILEIDLEEAFVEYVPEDPAASLLAGGGPRIRDLVEALQRARSDDRVVGVVARVGGGGSGMAIMQEIRDAVGGFRDSGKWAVAWAETIGEISPGNVGYYAATAFDEIWLQPTGDVNLTGFIFETPFLHSALNKLYIEPHYDSRYEYKNAKNLFTDTDMTAAHEEASRRLMESQFEQVVAGVAAARDMAPQAARALFDHGPFLGEAAVTAGVVDGMAYRDEVRDRLRERAGGDASFLDWRDYLKRAGRPHTSGTGVALIYGVGMVLRGESGYNPVLGELTMGSDTVAGAFRDAIADDGIEAILFRVDSPGGSAVASETIRREVVRARNAGKRVVISMGNVAASGGYWVSMDADRIIAQPGTITASIGVVAGKFLTTGFWNWTGITWDDVQTGPFSSFYSGSYDYTDEQWAAFQTWLDRIYDEFTRGVAAGRDLPLERVQEIARGRVWTGADALERGLVDDLGGFDVALRHIRELLELEDDAPLNLRLFPREKTTFEKLTALMEGGSETRAAAAAMARTLQEVQPLIRGAGRVAVPPAARGVVHTPAVPAVE